MNFVRRRRPETEAGLIDDLHKPKVDHLEKKEPRKLQGPQTQNCYNHPREQKLTRIIAITLLVLSLLTRLYKIDAGNFVLWDEAHFGKFASYYLKREFYFDVHPPLGKMLVALAGYLAGYTGDFGFESGQTYPANINYAGMRMLLALFGVFAVPLTYLTALELQFSRQSALLAALLLLLDNGIVGISRLILLDSMLIFFTIMATYYLCAFNNRKPFSRQWFLKLFGLGLSLGCVSSVKWVGLFTTALVGLHTIQDLWQQIGDVQLPKKRFLQQFLYRAVFLILLPMAVYIASFKLHFMILTKSGPGNAQMSSLFQAGLEGSTLWKNPPGNQQLILDVAYLSKVTLKNTNHSGGLLHSHVQTFPLGSFQQQVTVYHHNDSNNYWIIKRVATEPHEEDDVNNVNLLKDGDVIRLVHEATGANLHSHPIKSSVTTKEFEVSGYGNDGIVDYNDNWRIEIVSDVSGHDGKTIKSLSTRFRLRHLAMDCYLRSTRKPLPDWGFKQGEVTCQRTDSPDDTTLWNVETHINDKIPPGERSLYRTNFLYDLMDVNVGMYISNNSLIPNPDLEPGIITSTPSEWPFLLKGIRMSGWGDDLVKFYLLGNPLVWWGSAASVLILMAISFGYLLRWKRGMQDFNENELKKYLRCLQVSVGGWMLHYTPFFLMGRVTYLHHYFPALFFGIMSFAFLFDHFSQRCKDWVRWSLFFVVASAVLATFLLFSPICYGMEGAANQYESIDWISSWNIINSK